MNPQQKAKSRAAFEDVLQQARAGSKKELGRLLLVFEKQLLGYAHEHMPPELRCRCGSSDLVQETFLKANREFAHFNGSTVEQTFGWLLSILKNNVRNEVRRHHCQKRDVTQEVTLKRTEAADSPAPEEEAAGHEEKDVLDQALYSLSPNERRLLRLRFFRHLSYQEIGLKQGCSEEAARKHCAEALHTLGACYGSPFKPSFLAKHLALRVAARE